MRREIFIFTAIFIFSFGSSALLSPVAGDLNADKEALLDFLNNITHSSSSSLAWNSSSPVCATWTGVTCDQDGLRVITLRLPGASLLGIIPPNILSRLSELQILSLRSNGLQGPFPGDFLGLKKLTQLYLQSNRFSDGSLPSDFTSWKNLKVLDLSNNRFNGSIPAGFANLTGLVSLNLADNSFSGQIPDLNLPKLQYLNLSNNKLTGTIPKSLLRFGRSAFSGNNIIYENAPPLANTPSKGRSRRKQAISLSKTAILGIAIGGCFLIFIVAALLIIICYANRQRKQATKKTKSKLNGNTEGSRNRGTATEELEDNNSNSNTNGVVFFEGSSLVFNLEDLLRASADVLGKGSFGMTYKAVLEDLNTVAVKRLKDLTSVSQEDFERQMEIVGNIRHDNVVPLRAYVCSKDEKLMVYEFYERGSLSALLHGNNKSEPLQNVLDWKTRLKFIMGAAKGLAHIHTHKLAHGNIKSSNIFMNINGYGCISEIGLATLTNPVQPVMVSLVRPQYRAPEVTDTRRSTPESDVYSFGVLILEILTGKSPSASDREVDNLVMWVNSVLREQWTGEVFDLELVKIPEIEGKLLQMLELGLSCTVRVPERRPSMVKVVETLEEIDRV